MPSLFIGPMGQYVNTAGPSGSEMKAEVPKKKTVIKLASTVREDTLTKEIKELNAKKVSLTDELKAVNTSLFAKEQELVKSIHKRQSMGIFRKGEKEDEEEYLSKYKPDVVINEENRGASYSAFEAEARLKVSDVSRADIKRFLDRIGAGDTHEDKSGKFYHPLSEVEKDYEIVNRAISSKPNFTTVYPELKRVYEFLKESATLERYDRIRNADVEYLYKKFKL